MRNKLALFVLTGLAVIACHTSKKTTTSTAEVAKTTATTTTVSTSSEVITTTPAVVRTRKAFDGIYEPGEELTAIKVEYKDATIEQLKEGHILYSMSACVSCHNAVNIYNFPHERWPWIIQDMAARAKLTPAQKDAVTKYVYAIKAADPVKK